MLHLTPIITGIVFGGAAAVSIATIGYTLGRQGPRIMAALRGDAIPANPDILNSLQGDEPQQLRQSVGYFSASS